MPPHAIRKKTVRKVSRKTPTTKKATCKKPSLTGTQKLSTKVTKTLVVEAPCFFLKNRSGCSDSALIQHLEEKTKLDLYSRYIQDLTIVAHDDALHLLRGSSSIHTFFTKKEYEQFRKWADAFFSIT